MSVIDFEKQGADLAEICDLCRRMEARLCGAEEVRCASLASLARRYDCGKSTVREMLYQMKARGFRVDSYKVGAVWRVDVAQFDRAYEVLFKKEFV